MIRWPLSVGDRVYDLALRKFARVMSVRGDRVLLSYLLDYGAYVISWVTHDWTIVPSGRLLQACIDDETTST